ncbi:MAG: hypothetical protein RL291_815 [Pseudomonadota bacterium]
MRVVEFPFDIKAADFQALIRAEQASAMILGLTPVGPAEVAASDALKVVARSGVGYDLIDVPALTAQGVPLMITGNANAGSVAEHALFGMLTVAKRSRYLDEMVRRGRWRHELDGLPIDLMGKTALVVGFGRIGTRITRRLLAMEMRVLVSDPYVPQEAIRQAGAEPVTDLDQAIAEADAITVHVPRTPETMNLIDARRLALMKPKAILVNTARGGIVDELALDAALRRGHLFGAALDVLVDEPPKPDHPLLKNERCHLAPHVAGVTVEAMGRMGQEAAENVLSVLDGRPNLSNVVNREVFER